MPIWDIEQIISNIDVNKDLFTDENLQRGNSSSKIKACKRESNKIAGQKQKSDMEPPGSDHHNWHGDKYLYGTVY